MTDLATLGLKVDSSDVRAASSDLGRFSRAGKAAEKSASDVGQSASGMGGAFKGAAVQIAAAVGAFASVQKALGAAERYTTMRNRITALGVSHEAAASQIQQLADISASTRAPLESTVALYSRLSLTADSLGASQQELMSFTETVGLALATSGSSAGEASGALTQLSQAMAGGVVRAEEFNSMVEGAPGLLMAVARGIDGVNGDLGKLRTMMLDGELTSEAFFTALLSQNDALKASFENTTPTIAQALGVLNDQFTLFIGEANSATGATSAIADGILMLAENMDVAIPVFGAVAVGVAAITAPVLAAGVAIGALAVAVITHWDEIKQAFRSGVEFVVGLGPRLVQALKDAGAAALEAAKQIGADIVNGIRQGISQKWDDLKSYVSGLGTGMLDGLKGRLGIKSPSREFAKLGGQSVEGLAVGWQENEHLILDAVSQTANSVLGIADGMRTGLADAFGGLFSGQGFGGFGGILSGIQGGLGSVVSGVLKSTVLSPSGAIGGAVNAFYKGAQTFAGNLFGAGGGLGKAFGGLTSALGNATSGLAGLAGAAGAAVLPIVGVAAVASLFKKKVVARGIRGNISGGELADLERYTKKKGFFGSSTSGSTLDDTTAAALQSQFAGISRNVRDLTGVIGAETANLDNFTARFKVNLKGLSDQQASQAIAQNFARIESAMLEFAFGETTTAMLGGIQGLTDSLSFYYQNFFTEVERSEMAVRQAKDVLFETFDDLGIALPRTAAGFRALVDSLDLTTEAGQRTFATLMGVADEFVTAFGGAGGDARQSRTFGVNRGGRGSQVDREDGTPYGFNDVRPQPTTKEDKSASPTDIEKQTVSLDQTLGRIEIAVKETWRIFRGFDRTGLPQERGS
jgi:tape measure domain-containing protein